MIEQRVLQAELFVRRKKLESSRLCRYNQYKDFGNGPE